MPNFPDYESARGYVDGTIEDVIAAVNAALCDEPLYQKHPCDGNHFIPEGAKCLEPTWIRVWPKEDDDESH